MNGESEMDGVSVATLFERTIPLTQGKVTIVDPDVYEWASKLKWYAKRDRYTWYAMRHPPKHNDATERLHRRIVGASASQQVDHIDGNGLNNLRSNLRLCSNSENSHNRRLHRDNTSGLKGVHFKTSASKYTAYIYISGKRIHLGYFTDKYEAAVAYNDAAKLYFGEFSRLNIIP